MREAKPPFPNTSSLRVAQFGTMTTFISSYQNIAQCTSHVFMTEHTLSTSFPFLSCASSNAAKISGYVLLCIISFPFVEGSPLSHKFQEPQYRTSVYEQNVTDNAAYSFP